MAKTMSGQSSTAAARNCVKRMSSEAFEDAKDDIVAGVFKFIDRMNDVCDSDTADRILNEFTQSINPLIEEYLELKFAPNHKEQLWLEFRSPEEIAAREAKGRRFARGTERLLKRLTPELLSEAVREHKQEEGL